MLSFALSLESQSHTFISNFSLSLHNIFNTRNINGLKPFSGSVRVWVWQGSVCLMEASLLSDLHIGNYLLEYKLEIDCSWLAFSQCYWIIQTTLIIVVVLKTENKDKVLFLKMCVE